MDESDIDNNLFIIVGHSGNGSNAYFNDLVYLEVGDKIIVNVWNGSLIYKIRDIYYKNKGYNLGINEVNNSIYLVTCSRIFMDKQIVIWGVLDN